MAKSLKSYVCRMHHTAQPVQKPDHVLHVNLQQRQEIFFFSKMSIVPLEPNNPSIQTAPGLLSLRLKQTGYDIITAHLHQALKLWMCATLPPLTSHAFTVWTNNITSTYTICLHSLDRHYRYLHHIPSQSGQTILPLLSSTHTFHMATGTAKL